MAVQAQYPSNVLLLNRNGQESHVYSLQQQPGGGFHEPSNMIFNNNGGDGGISTTNPRKRGREASAASVTTTPINPVFSLQQQSQPSQLIDLCQRHNQQPNVVSTGLRLSFGDQQQQQYQKLNQNHHHHHHQQQKHISISSPLLSLLPEDFAFQMKQQRDEVDQFLQAQEEQLRRTLAEKRQRHYRALLGAAEESIARRLREKAAVVEKATRRNADLEARAAQISVEVQVWQAKARAQEATAASLQAQLQQAIMTGGMAQDRRGVEDGLACAVGQEGQAEDAESVYIDPDRVLVSRPICKGCRKGVASVVLLPCRHLCLCTECDQVAQACPLCLCVRNSSVEVFLP